VVTDLMMPVLDGRSLISSMREAGDLRTIPVVVVTASTTGPIEGASAVLRKPCDPDRLLAAARAALNERRD
jgi:CheY-like chemotaxis protein